MLNFKIQHKEFYQKLSLHNLVRGVNHLKIKLDKGKFVTCQVLETAFKVFDFFNF
jgi:hypothetical protein